MGKGNRKWAGVALGILLLIAVWQGWRASQARVVYTLRGETMGTNYHVHAHSKKDLGTEALQKMVDARLKALNKVFSTYDVESEISRFNQAPVNVPFPLSEDMRRVVKAALDLARETDGAFDPTVGPLVDLWGFGPEPFQGPPSKGAIALALSQVGYWQLRLAEDGLTKSQVGLKLDLSAIAKGDAVDQISEVLKGLGFIDYLVEIGGEVRVAGFRPDGQLWRVGIELPEQTKGAKRELVYELAEKIQFGEGGVATSGSYRRFRKGGGHHIIDPRTGYSTNPDLVSVTVYSKNTMMADGIATALMVLGVKEGKDWVAGQQGVEVFFIQKNKAGGWEQHLSKGFPKLLATEK